MSTQKSNHTMFYQNLDEIQSFSKSVAQNEQEPGDLLSENCNQLSDRTFNSITGVQFVFLAIYWQIGEMLIRYIGLS